MKYTVIYIILGLALFSSVVIIVIALSSLVGWFEIGVPINGGSRFHRGLTRTELVRAVIVGVTVAMIALVILCKIHAAKV